MLVLIAIWPVQKSENAVHLTGHKDSGTKQILREKWRPAGMGFEGSKFREFSVPPGHMACIFILHLEKDMHFFQLHSCTCVVTALKCLYIIMHCLELLLQVQNAMEWNNLTYERMPQLTDFLPHIWVVWRIYIALIIFQSPGDTKSLRYKWWDRDFNTRPPALQGKSLTTRPPLLPLQHVIPVCLPVVLNTVWASLPVRCWEFPPARWLEWPLVADSTRLSHRSQTDWKTSS